MRRFYLLSLGCPKNLVDSEAMRGLLKGAGWRAVAQPEQADLLIVNTCGFIEPAREESYGALSKLAQGKGSNQALLATGCLAQRYSTEIQEVIPAVDGILGTREWTDIVECAEQLVLRTSRPKARAPGETSVVAPMQRSVRGPSAYLKIVDGCSAPCAFCAIPLIKGPQRSKPRAAILAEARQLVAQGVHEIILIGQDTTAYGHDLGERDALPSLIEGILEAEPALRWLRLMYAYPQHVTSHLIATMAAHTQICHYLDLPLQHAHPATLLRMHRSPDVDRVRGLIVELRQAMPDVALRTAFIVGYPGETEEEFDALLAFLAEIRFDKVGVFIYSPEEGTVAAELPNRVTPGVAQRRYARAMELQQSISLERNQEQLGRVLEVLVEGADQQISLGRCYRDAPEIDGYVLMPGEWPCGHIVSASIEGATEYDLHGRVLAG